MGDVPPEAAARREGSEPWMLKKVDRRIRQARRRRRAGRAMRDQRHHRPDDGRDRRGQPTSGTPTAAAERRAARRRKAGRRARRQFQPPQLATLVDAVPTGNDWLHEYKYDGYRLLIATGGGAATAWTRNGHDWSDKFRADRQGRGRACPRAA